MRSSTVTRSDELDAAEVAAVRALVTRATEVDGVAPLSEQVLLAVRSDGRSDRLHLLAHNGGSLVGYAQLDRSGSAGTEAEAVVAPDARGSGYGHALVTAAIDATHPAALRVWAHGELPAAVALAESHGFVRTRALWQMARALGEPAPPVPEPAVPSGISIRTFEVGADDQAWVALNAAAFADHPEQGRMTRRDLDERIREPWFEPDGFFLAERHGTLVGFHWTKAIGDTGEVYVIGVHPSEQGGGLGTALLLVGLRHLANRGLARVTLFVEGDNAGAIGLYSRLGFTHTATDAMYTRTGPDAS